MSEDALAIDRGGGRRSPTPLQPGLQQSIRARRFVPHGDRRDRAQSRRVVDEVRAAGPPEHDVAGELVLVDHIDERQALGERPADGGLQRGLGIDGGTQGLDLLAGQAHAVVDGDRGHGIKVTPGEDRRKDGEIGLRLGEAPAPTGALQPLMTPRFAISFLLLLLGAPACEARSEAAGEGDAKAELTPEVKLTPEQVQARLAVADANLTMGSTEVSGMRVQSLSCAKAKRPLLEGMAMVGAFAEHKEALEGCAPKGAAVVVNWAGASGMLSDLDVYSGQGAEVNACVGKALASAESPMAGPCATVLLLGDEANADAAAAAWTEKTP